MDQTQINQINVQVKELTPSKCPELKSEGEEGPSFDMTGKEANKIIYRCQDGRANSSICVECPFFQGKEFKV